MKIIVILLALAGVPLLMGLFQKAKFNNALKPELEKAAYAKLAEAGVDKANIDFNHLDATISGVTATVEDREGVKALVDDLGKGAVRAFASDDLKTHGSLHISKQADALVVNGNLSDGTWDKSFSKPLIDGGAQFTKGGDFKEEGYYINPAITSPSASNMKWMNDFLALPGDRGLKVSSKTNEITLYGQMTEKLKSRVLASADEAGLQVNPEFEMIPANEIKLNTQSSDDGVVASGTIPDDLDLGKFKFKQGESLKKDPFTDAPAGVYADGFNAWHNDYYTDMKARRGYALQGDALTLSGYATPFMVSDWKSKVSALKLKPSAKELELFPSAYHYPSYDRVSTVSDSDLKNLNEAFALNQVFFDTGSSEVVGGEVFKVDALAAAILSFGKGAKFVIGGHADSTGNVAINQKLSKQRAEAVLTALAERQVDRGLFTVGSFGSSKAKKAGDSSSDRRVEILVK